MKFIIFLTLAVAPVFSAYGSPLAKLSIASRLPQEERQRLRRLVGSCKANICFAIDGSGALTPREFEAEVNFVLDAISVVVGSQGVELAAVQYGNESSPISPLTSSSDDVILNIFDAQFLNAGDSFAVAGIDYCFSELFRRREEASRIVLLSDSGTDIGGDAVASADEFRRIGGEVWTVGAGFAEMQELLAIAGGDPGKVFDVSSFHDVRLKYIFEDFVLGICGLNRS